MNAHTPQVGQTDKRIVWLIAVLSVAIPLVVAVLLFMPKSSQTDRNWVLLLPHLNATLNTATFVCLVSGFVAIRQKSIIWHRTFMMSAFTLSSFFLISYVLYHYAGPKTLYGDVDNSGVVEAAELALVGAMRSVYLIILLTHIVLAVVIVPLVLFAVYFALSNQIEKHKRIVKWTLPIWLYVAATGVIVYAFISPYYN